MWNRQSGDRLILGITGPIGSGVSTVSDVLSSQGFFKIKLSEFVKEEYRQRKSIPANTPISESSHPGCRNELQDIGDEKRQLDIAYWIKKAVATIGDGAGQDVVIEGVRNLGEVFALRELFHRFFLLAIHASRDERWKRVRDLYDMDEKRFDRDNRRDQGGDLPFGQQVGKCVQEADYVLDNDKDFGPEQRQNHLSDVLLGDLRLMRDVNRMTRSNDLRPPSPEEGHMAAAYAESHISRCLKRHVGAIIVDYDGRILSVGYNENPFGMPPCVVEFNRTCFKDDDMHRKLAKMDRLCPNCGEAFRDLQKPWKCPKCQENLKLLFFPDRNLQLCTAIHAEERAVLSLNGRPAPGATLFTTTFPCFQCARKIADARISRVFFVEAYPIPEAVEFLIARNIQLVPFQGFKARAFNLIFRQME